MGRSRRANASRIFHVASDKTVLFIFVLLRAEHQLLSISCCQFLKLAHSASSLGLSPSVALQEKEQEFHDAGFIQIKSSPLEEARRYSGFISSL